MNVEITRKITVSEYLERTVLPDMCNKMNQYKTKETYVTAANFIRDVIGSRTLEELSICDLQVVMNERLKCHSPKTNRASKSTMKHTKCVLAHMIYMANVEGYITSGVCEMFKRKRFASEEQSDADYKVLSKERIRQMLDFAKADSNEFLYTVITVLSVTGIRPQELRAIERMDVDFDTKRLKINKAVKVVEKTASDSVWNHGQLGVEVGETKTKHGGRTIPLPDWALTVLKKWIAHLENHANRAVRTSALLFPNQNGNPFGDSVLEKRFACFRNKHNIDSNVTLYCFRHTFCTRALEAGVQRKALERLMGHSSMTMIDNVYGHLTQKVIEDGTQKIIEMNEKIFK